MKTMDSKAVLINRLSDSQDALLSFLPIPSAILSICGSCTIIYVALKEKKGRGEWTPYTRLLLGLSISDIIVSATLAGANFLRPRATSVRHYALGNEATCSTLGFFNQIGTSAFFYNAMLAIYFVLTARFGYKNSYIAQRIEPFMHFISIGYPLMAAAVGSVIEIWGEMPVHSLGCYIPDCNALGHVSHRLSLMFYAVPMAAAFILLFCCNCMVAVFVWRNTRSSPSISSDGVVEYEISRPQPMMRDQVASINETMSSPGSTKRKLQHLATTLSESIQQQKMQNRRLRLVASQAILYVGCFFLSYVWVLAIKYQVHTTNTKQGELDLQKTHYTLMVLEALFQPSQGFFNMFVFLRPKFWKARQQYPRETAIWAARRAVFGEEIEPSSRGQTTLGVHDKPKCSPPAKPTSKPSPGIDDCEEGQAEAEEKDAESKASAEGMEWESTNEESETRYSTMWDSCRSISHNNMWSKPLCRSGRERGSSLEAISEISVSFFEPFDAGPIEETKSADLHIVPPKEKSEHRWNSSSSKASADKGARTTAYSLSPIPPERVPTDIDLSFHSIDVPFDDSTKEGGGTLCSSHSRGCSDTPILAPKRRISPPERMIKDDVESLNRWQ